MIEFSKVIIPLTAALGLSVAVERVLEFFKNFIEPLIGLQGTRDLSKQPKTNQKLKELKDLRKAAKNAEQKELGEESPHTIVLAEPATDPDDGATVRTFIIQLLGFSTGIILARIFNVQLFTTFFSYLDPPANLPHWIDYLLTGLLIGGGSAPVHTLIQFISERKIVSAAEPEPAVKDAKPEVTKVSAPAVITSPASADKTWIEIPYAGGIDIDVLANCHRRKKDPEMIIFHHTAMTVRSTFEDVVKVIKSSKDAYGNNWYTGYNCVIMYDGSIKPFCRWDRFGTHAAGYNEVSLGISFNGNFETDPKAPCSNAAGNYGPARPSEIQLNAGARVIALWTFLYPIKLNFDKFIIPHKNVSQKTCPGNQFPYDNFKKLIEFYRKTWEKSSYAKERIAEFKLKPYLYHNREA